MKITDFFSPSKSFTNKEEERLLCTTSINNTEQQENRPTLAGMSGSITVQTPRKKKERFTDPEVHILVDTILDQGSKALNASGKAMLWDKVVMEVNKVGDKKRTKEECKKKWQDYKRKVHQIIKGLKMQSSEDVAMMLLSENLSRRQMRVAEFFKMDTSNGPKRKIHDESSPDIECVSSNEHMLTPSGNIESEDEFVPSQKTSYSSPSCLPTTSHQDKLISQSFEVFQAESEPTDPPNTKAVDMSVPPHSATDSKLQVETQMDQLVAQQETILEILQNIQDNVTASLNIQNKTYNLVKNSFREMHKTLLSSQKASSDHRNMSELRINSLHTKLDEITSILRVKQFQDIMSSDEEELGASSTQDIRFTPTATYTPATTPKKSTPARKRAMDQTPSPSDSMKKKKPMMSRNMAK